MVAPSFQNYKMISEEPFLKGNCKLYVTVEHPNTKNHRDVRWYTEAEYAKLYEKKDVDKLDDNWDMKHARGFDNGPILVIRNNRPENEPWLRDSCARYAVGIGWYIVSTDTLPDDAPKNLKYLLLGWDEFRGSDDHTPKKPTVLADILLKKAKNGEWVKF